MKGEKVEQWLKDVTKRKRLVENDPEGEIPQEKPKSGSRRRKMTPEGRAMTKILAETKPLAVERLSNDRSGRNIHDDKAANARAEGREPLLPNEMPVSNPHFRALTERMRGPQYQRAGDYDRPFMPSDAFIVDSIAPQELTRFSSTLSGAPDMRHPGASFPGTPAYGLSGTQSRHLAEKERVKMGAPQLHPNVNPGTLGGDSPTPLELLLMAMKPGQR